MAERHGPSEAVEEVVEQKIDFQRKDDRACGDLITHTMQVPDDATLRQVYSSYQENIHQGALSMSIQHPSHVSDLRFLKWPGEARLPLWRIVHRRCSTLRKRARR